MLFVCHPKILHKHCFQFLLGVKMAPRDTENNAYAKFWGDKQRALWYVMVFLEWSIEDLDHVVNWSKMNKMVIRKTKKNSMLAVGKRLRKRSDRAEANINLSLNWAIIEQVKNHKLLSIHIGQDLDSDAQSVALCKSLSKKIGLL